MPAEAESELKRPRPAPVSGGPASTTMTGDAERALAGLIDFLAAFDHLAILTGAGCSTASGIPDYRDDHGNWKYRQPVQFAEFLRSSATRRRYWAQSFAGWTRIESARPNPAHLALARLEELGRITCVITQNVDNLHRTAGSRNVIDLHGVLHKVRCLNCGAVNPRSDFQSRLGELNPRWRAAPAELAPDGDARLAREDFHGFTVPDCGGCGGILKPDVVFFGEPVPAERVSDATRHLLRSDALLVVGSSLMVFSGFRFARLAIAAGMPLAIVNRGATRADGIATHKLEGDCGTLLAAAIGVLSH